MGATAAAAGLAASAAAAETVSVAPVVRVILRTATDPVSRQVTQGTNVKMALDDGAGTGNIWQALPSAAAARSSGDPSTGSGTIPRSASRAAAESAAASAAAAARTRRPSETGKAPAAGETDAPRVWESGRDTAARPRQVPTRAPAMMVEENASDCMFGWSAGVWRHKPCATPSDRPTANKNVTRKKSTWQTARVMVNPKP